MLMASSWHILLSLVLQSLLHQMQWAGPCVVREEDGRSYLAKLEEEKLDETILVFEGECSCCSRQHQDSTGIA